MEPLGPGGIALMSLLAALQLLYLGVSATLGVRLLRRAKRERRLPELLLGLHFVLCLTVGYVLYGAAMAIGQEGSFAGTIGLALLAGTGQLLSSAGVLANVAFTWKVFRPREPWALGLVWGCAGGLAVGALGFGLSGGFAVARGEGAWFWLNYGTMIVGAAWAAYEALRYHRLMRRRGALGLADPVLTNRFLLWGGGSLARLGMLLVGAVPLFYLDRFTPQNQAQLTSLTFTATSLLGVVVSVTYWLTFFPPRAYLRRLERSRAVGAGTP